MVLYPRHKVGEGVCVTTKRGKLVWTNEKIVKIVGFGAWGFPLFVRCLNSWERLETIDPCLFFFSSLIPTMAYGLWPSGCD